MKKLIDLCFAASFGIAIVSSASAVELLDNGGFETGDLGSWQHLSTGVDGSVQIGDLSAPAFFIADSDNVPLLGDASAVAASEGTFFAVSNYQAAGATLLGQSFTVDPLLSGDELALSFDMFVNNNTGFNTSIHSDGLDSNVFFGTNVHARVDILNTAGFLADPFTTSGSAIVSQLYSGADPYIAGGNLYTNYSFDISGLLSAGGDYTVRFANVSTGGYIGQGIDNVSVRLSRAPVVTPEPASIALMSSGLLGVMYLRRRQKELA